jgi:hypothetical protein
MGASVKRAGLLESGERERGSYAEGGWERACKRAGFCVSARGRGIYAEGGWDRANWRVSVCVHLRWREGARDLRRGRMEASGRAAGRACDGMEARERGSFLEGELELSSGRASVCVNQRGDSREAREQEATEGGASERSNRQAGV